jgi:RHS repeat-associated protein
MTSFHSANGSIDVSARRYRYNDKERDEETGLYYYGTRYYVAWLGRWTAVDPSLAGGMNRYVYVQNRPIVATDPNGEWPSFGVVPSFVEIEWRPTSNYAAFFDASTDVGLMS